MPIQKKTRTFLTGPLSLRIIDDGTVHVLASPNCRPRSARLARSLSCAFRFASHRFDRRTNFRVFNREPYLTDFFVD